MIISYFRPLYLTIDIVAMFFEIGPIGSSLERIAFILRTSPLRISCFKFEFIQGDLDARTRFVFNGACLSAQKRNILFHSAHILFGFWNLSMLPQPCMEISRRKFTWIEILKFSISDRGVALTYLIDR